MRVLALSITEEGRAICRRLPYERQHGEAGAVLRSRWRQFDAFVLVLATGAAVRLVAPLLTDKESDPGIVCVDEAARFAVSLTGGHSARANELTREVAALLGAEPVITTATDATSRPALDALPGLIANGDVAGVTTAMLDGLAPFLERRLDWPLPASLLRYTQSKEQREAAPAAEGEGQAAHPPTIVVTDEATAPRPGLVVLSPPSLVVGAGTASEASSKELIGLFEESMAAAGLDERSVGAVATIDRRASHGALRALAERLSVPLIAYPAERLAAAGAPHPSRAVKEAVGTPSVAEAAALTAAGSGARLVLAKTSSRSATVAVARRERPPGRLALVGIGPGGPDARTAAASTALRNAEVVVGYEGYLNLCSDLVATGTEVVPSSIGEEAARARLAVALASEGRSVAVVSSGDSGVYAMAPLVLELAGETAVFEVEVVPGVTAALAAAARLGAPLGHDHAVLSLSDLMTPWQLIRERVIAARDADLVLCLYNPRSARRSWQLTAVRELLLERRRPETPVGIVTNASRLDESVELTILSLLDVEKVGMTTCVIVGSSRTRIVGGRMVTPRGYELADEGR